MGSVLPRVVATAISVDTALGPAVTAIGSALAGAGLITTDHAVIWAGVIVALAGAVVKVLTALSAGATVTDHTAALLATSTPTADVIARATPSGAIVAGPAHPAVTGTILDPAKPLSTLQAIAAGTLVPVLAAPEPPAVDLEPVAAAADDGELDLSGVTAA